MRIFWRICEIIYGIVAVLGVGSMCLLVIFCELRLAADWIAGGSAFYPIFFAGLLFSEIRFIRIVFRK